jgi:cell volume regulation protein A
MDSVALFCLVIAGIFLIGAIGEVIFQRTNIPDVIWLILAGMIMGPILGWLTPDLLNGIAPYFAAVTLVVVLFEGGSTLNLSDLSRAAPRSSALALLTFGSSVVAVAMLSMVARWTGLLPPEWSLMHGVLLGVILGGSSSIIIMPAMAQARVEPKIANLVNIESALTDALCVVGTSALIDIMLGGGGGSAVAAVTLAKSFGIGAVIGLVSGLIWLLFLKLLHSNEHAYPVTLAALLSLYVLINNLGGSAALGILVVAIILGNARGLSKTIGLAQEVELDTSVRGFHRQMAFIIKSFFFVFIGAMLRFDLLIVLGLVLGLALFGARIPAVYAALVASGLTPDQKKLAAVAMPRGLAAGVLATLPVTAGVPGTEALPTAVFWAVFTTILIFAIGFFKVKARLEPAPPEAGEVPLPAGAARPSVSPAPIATAIVPPAVPVPPPAEPGGSSGGPLGPG